jgi:tetratricopeptide (TPR) repeat protein
VWNAHGVALEMQGRHQEATEAYERALAIAPSHRKAANNLGFLLEKRMQRGEPELRGRAVEAWKRRLVLCHREGQSIKKAMEHLARLEVSQEAILEWINLEHSVQEQG